MIPPASSVQDKLNMYVYNFVLGKIKKHLELYNFTEIYTTITETEGVPSLVRAYLQNNIQQTPWKVFLHSPLMRYYQQQETWRQITQLTLATIKGISAKHDVQTIIMLDRLFTDVLGLENYSLKIHFIDDKKSEEAHQFKETICTWLDMLSITYVIDSHVTPERDYYQKIVFSFSSKDSNNNHPFCYGGQTFLGKSMGTSEDFSVTATTIDMDQLVTLIEKNTHKLLIPQEQPLHVIIPETEEQIPLALLLADDLRIHYLASEIFFETDPLESLIKKANKRGAKYILTIGKNNQLEGTVSVNNLYKNELLTLNQACVVSFLRS
jgi:histidyl-tRNA synthetase